MRSIELGEAYKFDLSYRKYDHYVSTSPLLSKYLRKYVIKKTNQIAHLSTQGYPIHCVITSQTKYSEPQNLVVCFLFIATKMPWCMIIVIISTLSIRMINNPSVFICFLRILFVTPSHVDNLLRGSEYLVWLKKGLHCITSVAHTWLHLKIVNYTQCNRNILHQCALQCIFIYTKYENVKSVNNLL